MLKYNTLREGLAMQERPIYSVSNTNKRITMNKNK
jgi:hypothetical protein